MIYFSNIPGRHSSNAKVNALQTRDVHIVIDDVGLEYQRFVRAFLWRWLVVAADHQKLGLKFGLLLRGPRKVSWVVKMLLLKIKTIGSKMWIYDPE